MLLHLFTSVLLFLIPSCSLFCLKNAHTHSHKHFAFSCLQREVPGGGDPSMWQRRSAAASRTSMCGSVFAFGDDLVSQSFIQALLTYGDICSRSTKLLLWLPTAAFLVRSNLVCCVFLHLKFEGLSPWLFSTQVWLTGLAQRDFARLWSNKENTHTHIGKTWLHDSSTC